MDLNIEDIRPSYDEAKRRGAKLLRAFRNTRTHDLEPVYVKRAQDPDNVVRRYIDNRGESVHAKTIDLRQDLESQL